MSWHAAWLASGLLLLPACQIKGSLFEERFEPECRAGDATRTCFCDDGRAGVAECLGAGESGACDCVGRAPGGAVVELAMGGLHTCAVLADDRVACWGDNGEGQLGNGQRMASLQPTATRIEPDVEQLALGGDDLSGHGCALLQDRRLQCWGHNEMGQLGDGTRERRLKPVTLELGELAQVAAGASHTCAVTSAGEALCWGDNAHDQLGYVTLSEARSVTPMPVSGDIDVAQIALGRYHSCAIDTAGDVWCWGEGEHGQLGDGGDRAKPEPVRVEGLSHVTQLALGGQHSCALDADHRVHCWGRNHWGQLGSSRPQPQRTPVPVEDLPESAAIAAGWNHTCALDRGGTVRCWGHDEDGQLGARDAESSYRAVEVSGLADASAIAAALNSTCAVLENGGAMCWGDNRTGQLGDGTDVDRDEPVSVRWLDAPITDADAPVTDGDGGTM